MYLSITTKLRLNSINIFSEGTFYVPSEVEVNSIREAQGKVQDILDEMSCKDCGRLAECVDDSAQRKQPVYLQVDTRMESELEYFENGFKIVNCPYTLNRIMEV